MKASSIVAHLESDQLLIIKEDQDTLLHKCCDCGLWHKVNILRKKNGDIGMQWIRLDEEPDVDDYYTEILNPDYTRIIKGSR